MKFILPLSIILIIGVVLIAYQTGLLDTDNNKPKLSGDIDDHIVYWNFTSSLYLDIEGDYSTNDTFKVLIFDPEKTVRLSNLIRNAYTNFVELRIKPQDTLDTFTNSRYGFLVIHDGMIVSDKYFVEKDTVPPELEVIALSEEIEQGSIAAVVFKAVDDKRMSFAFVRDNDYRKFYALPYLTNDYYAALFGWYVTYDGFSAKLIAADQAGNAVTNNLSLTETDYDFKVTKIYYKQNYADTKKEELGLSDDDLEGKTSDEKYTIIATAMKNVDTTSVKDLTSIRPRGFVTNFFLNEFDVLPDSWMTSDFALYRKYYYQGSYLKASYHMGLDIDSGNEDDIIERNNGQVVYSGYNSGYGYTLIIHYGMGLYGRYSHCSELYAKAGDWVVPGQVIARTGATGSATGVHLHLGIILQGLDMNPHQWRDEDWMEKSVYSVLKEGKQFILSNI